MAPLRRRFRPTLGGTLATLIATALFVSLAFWQLDRADQKRRLQAQVEARMAEPPLAYTGQPVPLDTEQYRRVSLAGNFVPDAQVLLDNVVVEGRPGYEVITAFRIAPGGSTVLVDRGWVPAGPSREQVPQVATPTGELSISGRIDRPRSRPPLAGDNAAEDAKRWSWLDLDLFRTRTGMQIPDFVVLLSPDSPGGFVREWPAFDAKVGMHIGYAIQWVAFALFALATYIWVSLKRRDEEQT